MENKDFTLKLKASVSGSFHIHGGIECILVIRGQVKVVTDMCSRCLKEDDFVVININQVHSVSSQENSIVLILKIEQSKLRQECGSLFENKIFIEERLENDSGLDKSYFELKRIMLQMFAVKIEKSYGYELAMNMYLVTFLHLLYTTFSEHKYSEETIAGPHKGQIGEILSYIDEHYKDTLTLEEIAARFYMSPAYFSRYFKKATGTGYLNFLQNIRVEKSVVQLLYSNSSILEVALDNGFKNARAYSNCFIKRYNLIPSVYRKKHQEMLEGKITEDSDIMLSDSSGEDLRIEFLRYIKRYDIESVMKTEPEVNVEISLDHHGEEQIRQKDVILLIDTPDTAMRINFSQVPEIKKKLNAKYAYFQILNYEIAKEGITYIVSENLMMAVERIREVGLFPFVRIDFAESRFHGNNGEITNYIHSCLGKALEALAIRFTSDYRKHWKFEIVCSFLTHEQSELFYREVYQTIRKYYPYSDIGLFAETDEDKKVLDSFEQLLEYCIRLSFPPQFVTCHSIQNRIKSRYPKDTRFFDRSADYHTNTVQNVLLSCKKYGIEPPIYLTVWNTLSGKNDGEISMYVRTALIWDSLLRLCDKVEGIGYRFATGETCPYSGEYYGSLLNLFILYDAKMPVYFAAEFLKRMAGEVLYHSDNVVATFNSNRELIVALWNPQLLNPVHAIDSNLTESLSKKMKISIYGLKKSEYMIKRFTVDTDSNGAFSRMASSGYPDWRDEDVLSYMRNISVGDLIVLKKRVIDGKLVLESLVRYNGIVLYVIKL